MKLEISWIVPRIRNEIDWVYVTVLTWDDEMIEARVLLDLYWWKKWIHELEMKRY